MVKFILSLFKKNGLIMEQLITINPEIQSSAPVFYNTRVPIRAFFDYLKGGHTVDESIDDFPSVKHERALNLLDFVLHLLKKITVL